MMAEEQAAREPLLGLLTINSLATINLVPNRSTADPVTCASPLQVVGEALVYFGLHFRDPILITDLAQVLHTSVDCLDDSFDRIRGMTTAEALQDHRLNKLFVALTDQPRQGLARAIRACGLEQTTGVPTLFEQTFGIAMPLFLLTCRRAADDRLFRRQHPEYVSHLISVSALVWEDGGAEDQAIAALLHDAIEDAGQEHGKNVS
jgi:AraC-like DNA-binding protein